LDKTQSNKALLKDLMEKVIIGGEYDKMNEFFDDEGVIFEE
jgi:hypothetical protein